MQRLTIPILGLTDYPDMAPVGRAQEAFNIDLSDKSARKRNGCIYSAAYYEDPKAGVECFPTFLDVFTAQGGAEYEIRGMTPIDGGYSYLQALVGLGGPSVDLYPVGTGLRVDQLWSGCEFNGHYIVATDYVEEDDNNTLFVFDPNVGWEQITAVDRTVTPFHGSEMFMGLDGDDEGPYLLEPPKGRLVASCNGRLFVGIPDDEGDAFRYSNFGDYRGWSANNIIRLKTSDNTPVVGWAVMGSVLVIFKRRSIHVASVFSQYDATVREVVSGIGCVAKGTIASIPGGIIFLSEDGVYAFNGQSVTPLSQNIERRLRERSDTFDRGTGVYYRNRRQYILTIPSGTHNNGLMNDLFTVLHLGYEGEWSEHNYSRGSGAPFAVRPMCSHLRPSGEEFLMVGVRFASGVLHTDLPQYVRLDYGAEDIGGVVEARYVTAPIRLGEHSPKRFTTLRTVCRHMGSHRIRVYWMIDQETREQAETAEQYADVYAYGDYQEQDYSLFGEAFWGRAHWTEDLVFSDRLPLYGAYGRTISLAFEQKDDYNDAGPMEIISMTLDATAGGRW